MKANAPKKVIAIIASTIVTAITAISVTAATCPPHHPGQAVQTLVKTQSAGTHSHYMGTDINGNPMFQTCYITIHTYTTTQRCQVCKDVINSSTFNVEDHSAWN